LHGFYGENRYQVSPLQQDGRAYLDVSDGNGPWYSDKREAVFFDASVDPKNNIKTIKNRDTPRLAVPWDYEKLWPRNQGVNAGDLHYLQRISGLWAFYLDVAAQTVDAPSDYWAEARAPWYFNGSGDVGYVNPDRLDWTGLNPPPGVPAGPTTAAGVYAPAGW